MSVFTKGPEYLEYHHAGETLRIMSWGENSFRVVSVPNGPLDLKSSALLPQASTATIEIQEDVATITNGNISATIDTRGWNSAAVVTFYNDKKEPILREINGGGALVRKARFFKAHIGGDFRLKATFEANPNEKIYGMGQYQQDLLDLKGCNIELATATLKLLFLFMSLSWLWLLLA